MNSEEFFRKYATILTKSLPNPKSNFTNPKNKAYRDAFLKKAKEAGRTYIEPKDYKNIVMNVTSLKKYQIPNWDDIFKVDEFGLPCQNIVGFWNPKEQKFEKQDKRKKNQVEVFFNVPYIRLSKDKSYFFTVLKCKDPNGKVIWAYEDAGIAIMSAMIKDIVKVNTGIDIMKCFVLAVAEKTPFEACDYPISLADIKVGEIAYKKRLNSLLSSIDRGYFETYKQLNRNPSTGLMPELMMTGKRENRLTGTGW